MDTNTKDLIEFLTTPTSMVVAVVWLHYRLKRIEDKHDDLARAFGVCAAEHNCGRKRTAAMLLTLILLLALLLLSAVGCGTLHTYGGWLIWSNQPP